MTQQELMDLARWHEVQADVCHQDYERAIAIAEHESARRAFNLHHFHTKATSDLRSLAAALFNLNCALTNA